VKVKTQIFKCTGLMPSDLGNPYIHSATALCDTIDYDHLLNIMGTAFAYTRAWIPLSGLQ